MISGGAAFRAAFFRFRSFAASLDEKIVASLRRF